jgi:hypothetical protein
MANVAVTKTNREQSEELRNSLGRQVDSGADANRGDLPPVQGVQGQINTENNVSTMFAYLNNGTDLYGVGAPENGLSWGSGMFDDEGGTAESTAATARENIEARSEVLTNEIAYDRARGLDITESLEAVVNLSENLSVLDANTNAGAFSFAVDAATEAPVNFNEIMLEEEAVPVTAASATETEQPAFAVSGAFEGSIAEQIVAASSEQTEDEMSIAAQIAAGAQAEHAEAISLTDDDGAAAASTLVTAQ